MAMPRQSWNLVEKANDEKIARVLRADLRSWGKNHKPEPKDAADLKAMLKSYSNLQSDPNTYSVVYEYGVDDYEGRLYAKRFVRALPGKRNNKKCASLQHFASDIRNYIAGEFSHDLDMVNTLPTLLHHLLEIHGIACPHMDAYVTDRATCLQEWNLAKQRVISMLLSKKHRDTDPLPLQHMHHVVHQRLLPILQNQQADLWKRVKASKRVKETGNPEGSFLSKVVFALENDVLMVTKEVLRKAEWDVHAFVFDGLMVARKPGPSTDFPADLLRGIEAAVFDKLKIKVKLIEKPMIASEGFLAAIETSADDERSLADWINLLPNFEEFDTCRISFPSLLNLSEWFIEVQSDVLFKHPNDFYFVCGVNKIWQVQSKISGTDLNIQVGRVLWSQTEKTLKAAYDAALPADIQSSLKTAVERVRGMTQNRDSMFIAENVARMYPTDASATDLFLSNPHILAFLDGVYDLNSGKFRSTEPEDYVLFHTGYNFPRRKNDSIRKEIVHFYESTFETGELSYFRLKTVASALYGGMSNQIFLVLIGVGAIGKGLEESLIQRAFGGYHRVLNKDNLVSEKLEPDVPNSNLVALYGARWIVSTEPSPTDVFRNALLKKLSSGVDYSAWRDVHGKQFQFRLTGLVNIQTNEDPVFEKMQTSMSRRIKVVRYPYRFGTVEDPANNLKIMDESLEMKFLTDAYRDEFMLMLIDLYRAEFLELRKLVFPDAVEEYTRKNLLNSLTAKEWFEDNYKLTSNKRQRVERSAMWAEYSDSMDTQARQGIKVKKMKKDAFQKELESIIVPNKVNGIYYYSGVEAKTGTESEESD
ncbi:TPA_asm: PolA-S3H [Powellomyces chytrid fungus MELD virus 3]|nr:TPA_asm: PolA-S3H [Powellomyces chytrid fungus MELD virus 3]